MTLNQSQLDKRKKIDHIMINLDKMPDKMQAVFAVGHLMNQIGIECNENDYNDIFRAYSENLKNRISTLAKKAETNG